MEKPAEGVSQGKRTRLPSTELNVCRLKASPRTVCISHYDLNQMGAISQDLSLLLPTYAG